MAAPQRVPIALDAAPPAGVQIAFDELGQPLRETTFTVVDLETTGGSAGTDAITEIGAVRVRGGQVLGEFQTLIDPGRPLSPFIRVLTGISDSMLAGAPGLASVLPAFLEFAAGSVLVAHNAPFDVGFLRAACAEHAHPWPAFAVVDTAVLARRVLIRDETPDCKLATLARYFGAQIQPTHRALADARATVDVLHALIGRLGTLGVHSLPELHSFTRQVSAAQRRKRHLADTLPHAPGVYVFRDASGAALYIGTSRDLRNRVRHYFVTSETRSRMGEMIALADRVDPVVCAHALEARVRELRLIAEHRPPYNKHSKYPERSVWLTLTDDPIPRLSIVRVRRRGDENGAQAFLGPLRSRRRAEELRAALRSAAPLPRCADEPEPHAEPVALITAAWSGDPRPLVAPLLDRIERLSEQQRYEQAATVRDRVMAIVRACARAQRVQALTRIGELVAAAPAREGNGWELSVVRYGRLAGAAVVARTADVLATAAALQSTGECIDAADPVMTEESESILNWLEQPGARLLYTSEPWTCPARGAGGMTEWLAGRAPEQAGYTPARRERRRLRTSSRPARSWS